MFFIAYWSNNASILTEMYKMVVFCERYARLGRMCQLQWNPWKSSVLRFYESLWNCIVYKCIILYSVIWSCHKDTCMLCISECTRGGFCNFMHLKPISRELKRELYTRLNHRRKRRSVDQHSIFLWISLLWMVLEIVSYSALLVWNREQLGNDYYSNYRC